MTRTIGLLAALLLTSCARDRLDPGDDDLEATRAPEEEVRFTEDPDLQGMKLTLREAKPPTAAAGEVTVAPSEPLSAEATAKLFQRLPALVEEDGDRQPFALRKGSAPPPLTGETVKEPWPPPESAGAAPEVAKGPLEVLRFMPEGDVPMAPHLSITFSQPMVAVTSQEEAAKKVPVKLTPQPEGRWRWLGTKTLMFDPDPRFPMATEYKVEIPAGTASANGDKLAEAKTFTFRTPPPTLQGQWPTYGPQDLEPVIFLGFDQKVDPGSVLLHTELRGKQLHGLRIATEAEIEADEVVGQLAAQAVAGQWVAVVPQEPLPKATSFTVTVKEGTPSAEGPRTTERDQAFGFATYAPLAVVEHECNWRGECPPSSGWYVRFNNPLDPDRYDPATLGVEPAIPGMYTQVYGEWLYVYGAMQGRTTYTLTLPADLADQFGQTLGKEQQLTFKVGPAEKTLTGPGNELVVLDPDAPAKVSFWSTNHASLKVRVHRVEPKDWRAWTKWLQKLHWDDRAPGALPGTKVHDGSVKVEGEADKLTETAIDLQPWLEGGHGQFIVMVEPTSQPRDRWNRQYAYAWVQVTKLGLAAFADGSQLVGWASALGDGSAVEGVELTVIPDQIAGTTGKDGLGVLQLGAGGEGPQVLVARKGSDVAILPQNAGWWNDYGGWVRVEQLDQLRWYVFDDRGLYRPGEKVRVKGWLRLWEKGPLGDVAALRGKPGKIDWILTGPMGNEIAKGATDVAGLGGFEIDFELPKDVNLGTAQLQLTATDAGDLGATSTWHPIQIQEFRRPEFEVSSTAEEGPHLLGAEADVTVTAAYYAGGGLPNADVTWSAWASNATYVPPNREGWSFGTWTPWWGWYGWESPQAMKPPVTLQGKTDASGEHAVAVHFEAMNPPRPMNVRVEATVFDVNRQAWTAGSDLLVHPAAVYVGLRTKTAFYEKGKEIPVEAIVVDLDGEAATGRWVDLRFARLEWGREKGQWKELEKDVETCTVQSAADAVKCSFTPTVGGSYRATALVSDDLGRKNESELRIWVSGEQLVPSRGVSQQQVTLVPEKKEFQPGETARVLVQAPFSPAEATLTVQRSGLVRTERFRIEGGSHTLEIPILEEHVPNVHVQLDLVGEAVRTDDEGKPRDDLPKRVAFASGSLELPVPPRTRTLDVKVAARAETVTPGGETTLDLVVTDAAGKPVPDAEIAVVVADEAVLALTGYRLPDPLAVFYATRPGAVSTVHSRAYVVLTDPLALQAPAPGAGGDLGGLGYIEADQSGYGRGGGGIAGGQAAQTVVMQAETRSAAKAAPRRELAANAPMAPPPAEAAFADGTTGAPATGPIALRADFSALALFAPDVRTDAAGKAAVPLKVPDSLTRYRVMVVVAAGGKQFGSGESAVTARLPLMVRPSAPRFMNFGDQIELPVVLQNQTDEPMVVDVAVRATNVTFVEKTTDVLPDVPDAATSSAGRRVKVPANDRVEVRFPAATVMAGTARFQAVGAAGAASDAATFEIPVWTPATTEAFATYGEIDQGAIKQPVEAPPDVWTQFGGLEVTTSSTQLQALTDAVIYLTAYPYECNEQIASRVMAIAALRDVLGAFESEQLPAPEVLEASVAADMDRLAARQDWNGGWSFWARGDETWPYISIHTAHALARAKDKGYDVPQHTWDRSQHYLRNVESHIPWYYSEEAKRTLRAYALYVRYRMGDTDGKEARRLYREAGTTGLPIEAQGWLLPVLHAAGATTEVTAIERHLMNNVTETAAGAHFVTGYSDGAHLLLHSDRRADGVVLEALIEVDPKNDLIPKVVRNLLGHRKRGHWENTQENAFVLLAMDRYFQTYEKQTPDFVARVWLGDGFAGEHAFRGRTTERSQVEVPMGYLTESPGAEDLVLQKDGEGRLYYRIGLRYAPKDLRLEPADYGFAVEREYEAVDDPGDVKRDEDGTWRIRAGSRVRVRVTMATPMRRTHVALVDPLPAGLEAMNPELATTGTIPQDPNARSDRYWWWWRTWYEHTNQRDERAEAFTSLLWEGVHEYTYVARATTPGRYVVPPAKAEEMYHPETFGRGGTDRVVIE